MNEIPIAVVGAGPWGRTISAAISLTPGISLAAIVSSRHKVPGAIDPAIPIVSDWREAAKRQHVAGFVLAIPPMHQTGVAIEMIESRIPVMLEKPMATSIKSATRIKLSALSREFCGLVNHLHIHAPAFKDLLNGLHVERGPKIIHATAGARGPIRADWSPLWDWASHDLAMVLSVIKSDPTEILATQEGETTEVGRWYQNYRIDLDFRDTSRAKLHVGNAFQKKLREFSVADGRTRICYQESEESQISVNIDGIEQPGRRNSIENQPLNAALITFANRIRNGGGIEDIELGERVVRLIDAAERSIRLNKSIVLDQI